MFFFPHRLKNYPYLQENQQYISCTSAYIHLWNDCFLHYACKSVPCSLSVSAGLKTDITDVASSSVFAAVTACNIKIA